MKAAVLALVVFAAACGTAPTEVPEPSNARTDIILLRNTMAGDVDPTKVEDPIKDGLPGACSNENFLAHAPKQAITQVCRKKAKKAE